MLITLRKFAGRLGLRNNLSVDLAAGRNLAFGKSFFSLLIAGSEILEFCLILEPIQCVIVLFFLPVVVASFGFAPICPNTSFLTFALAPLRSPIDLP